MFFLIYPLLFGIAFMPDPGPGKKTLADFSRVQAAIDEYVYVVNQVGEERFAKLAEADDQRLMLMIGALKVPMEKAEVLRVDRTRDRVSDGVLKGVLFGLVAGLLAQQGLDSESGGFVVYSMTVYGGIGYLLDRANDKRSPLYRAPPPSLTARIRF